MSKLRLNRSLCSRTSFWMILICCLICPAICWADSPPQANINITAPQPLTLIVGKSIVMEVTDNVQRVSLTDPDIADFQVLTPSQIYILAKSPGVTRFTLWEGKSKVFAVYDIEVIPDIVRLKEKLNEMFPIEEDIHVTATHDRITLTGNVSSMANLSGVMSLVDSYAPRDKQGNPKLNNLLAVGGVHQVMLEVQISEMARSLMKRLGFNFNVVNSTGKEFGINVLDNLSSADTAFNFPSGVSANVNAIFGFLNGRDSWTLLISALKDQGLLKVLAEPTLITLSGRSAKFLAGGEFPVPVPQTGVGGSSTITITYKTFGVGLQFTPTVLGNGRINIDVAPEVSELDFSNAVVFGGFILPALSTRRVSTVVELNDGQSFAIAGLLRDQVRESVRRFPLLSDIPILGSLFRSSSFQKNETELIIIVTPHLVKPVDMAKQTLPTDEYIEPDDFEFYLLGSMEGKEGRSSYFSTMVLPSNLDEGNGLEGDFGHIFP